MQRRAGRIFIKGFLLSFIIVVPLLGVGILAYQLTMKTLRAPEEGAIIAYQEETVPDSVTKAAAEDISKNLIYCYNEDTREITKLVLEVFHSKNRQLTYITIPMRTQLTMSDSLYREMVLINPEIPQVMLLSSMVKYLDSDTVFDYGVLIMEDLLGIDISYYTAIPQSIYDTIFTDKAAATGEGDASDGEEGGPSGQLLPVETFTEEYMESLKEIRTPEELSAYIESVYPAVSSNLSVQDKMKYLESYLATPLSNISFELIKGDDQNSAFLIDEGQASERLKQLTAGISNG